eukprot:Cvel_1567.t1-p1 / transcript=Cvel_1567.t1 / gene=Cvel_1567 / organism=Chromera_velia_CCMP2878 / gene_product=hypothetical protein / transcript_product=hypothetical protein / location=Cvel_scaffold56:466-2823(-) / protein_length=146 / sequence_SO=supercontig / SO=protein_coding / is_pseudo=false
MATPERTRRGGAPVAEGAVMLQRKKMVGLPTARLFPSTDLVTSEFIFKIWDMYEIPRKKIYEALKIFGQVTSETARRSVQKRETREALKGLFPALDVAELDAIMYSEEEDQADLTVEHFLHLVGSIHERSREIDRLKEVWEVFDPS